MKNLNQYLAGLCLLLSCISCSKKEKGPNCTLMVPAALIRPGFKFQLVDKNSGADLFFSASPAYSLNDIKIVFKPGTTNRDTTVSPLKENVGTGDHFLYIVPFNRPIDTCYIKIKNLKPDTLISTIERVTTECGHNDVVAKVQVNKGMPVAYSNANIIIIKK